MTRVYLASVGAPPRMERLRVSQIIPPSEKIVRTSVKLPDWMWPQLAEIARIESEEARAEGREPFTRDDVVFHFCRYGIEHWKADRAKKKRK